MAKFLEDRKINKPDRQLDTHNNILTERETNIAD